jgi:hypothetical protein
MHKTTKLLLSATATLAVVLWSGCKTAAPKPSGFLSDYSHLQQVNDSTWRYVDKGRLASYSKFAVSPAKMMVKQYAGTTFNAEQQQRISTTFRQKIVDALSGRYQVVSGPAANVAEVRAAITQAYRVGNALALGVEVEILDSESHQQLAALRGVQIGPPDVGFRMGYNNPTGADDFMAAWWNRPSAGELMERWAREIRKTIEVAQPR